MEELELVFFDEAVKILKSKSIGLIPCSLEEVNVLESTFSMKLPRSYKEYLLTMGKYSGPVDVGTNCFYKDLFKLRSLAEGLLMENNTNSTLPDDAFVFMMHQGYEFAFFRVYEGQNPPVYCFTEEDEELGIHKTFDCFTDYVRTGFGDFEIQI